MKLSRRDSLFIAFCAGLLALTAGSIWDLILYATDFENSYASQVLIVPFVSGVLFYLNRKNIFQRTAYSVVPGTLTMLSGAALFVAGKTLGTQMATGNRVSLMTFAVVVLWLGSFLFFYGTAAFKTGLFPLLFLLVAVPIPLPLQDRTIALLQHGSADLAFGILKLTGMPIFRQGVIFNLPDLVVEVAPQCSGIRSGISLMVLCLIAGHLMLNSWWRKGLLLLVAIPVLMLKNAIRISTLSFLAVHIDHSILTSRLHREGGIPFFIVGLLLMYPVAVMLMKSEKKRVSAATREVQL